MKLADLDKYEEIVIQVHDNPDADAVGSGYALYEYFLSKGKSVRLVYGGKYTISKSNMLLLVSQLGIPIEFVETLDNPELLITVDCQYGQGNVQKFAAQNVAVIDHHNTGKVSDDMAEIRSHLVSCATVCYGLLKDAGYDVNGNVKVATALYYGLFMDSNQFAEINHPYDRDMVDFLQYDKGLFTRLKYSNLSIEDFETAGIAIIRHSYMEKHRTVIIHSKACDPNILGLIGDLAIQVDCVDVCIVYSEYPGGYKFSVRSCNLEVAANELAGFLTDGIGNGGGHIDKSGGFIHAEKFADKYYRQSIETYFFSRMDEYFVGYDVIYYRDGISEHEQFKTYEKKSGVYGYVMLKEMFAPGTECKIRTLEGDVLVTCNENIYVMIGYSGEAYPIAKEVFEERYTATQEAFFREFEYMPSIINMDESKSYDLMPYAKKCMFNPGVRILARRLHKPTKVFTAWQYETYISGVAGDMLCYDETDETDVYVVRREIFDNIYEEVSGECDE